MTMKTLGWFMTMTLGVVCAAGCQTGERTAIMTAERLGRITGTQWVL